MKYETVIKIICDGIDEDDACHNAGEYLRGNVESEVVLTCKTKVLAASRRTSHSFIGITLVAVAAVTLLLSTIL